MSRSWWGACGAGAVMAMIWACSGGKEAPPREDSPPGSAPPTTSAPPGSTPAEDTPPPAGSTPPAQGGDGSTDTPPPVSGGGGDTPPPSQSTPPDTGTGTGTDTPQADPWPKDALVNYTQRFGAEQPQGVAVDDAFNIWLLKGNRIGVLRPGATQPVWASDIGQAGRGFSSTVICGGSAGRAYVGYYARELDEPQRQSYNDPVYTEGDLDAVMLTPEGGIALEEHVHHNFRRNREAGDGSLMWEPPVNIGLRNSNTWQYDEDRAVLTCAKVMRGRDKGHVYIGTNHGVTHLRGLDYNSHRHAVWFSANGSQHIGYNYGLGIAQDGDVLIANDWNFGIVTPNEDLGLWDWMDRTANPTKVDSAYLPELNSQEEFDYWRAFQQTRDGRYYLASEKFGLWEMRILSHGNPYQKGVPIQGLPTQALTSLAATDDGSLFIATDGGGLWRMDANKALARVPDVPGSHVKQLLYDPTATPAMLYVLTDSGLTVLRGY